MTITSCFIALLLAAMTAGLSSSQQERHAHFGGVVTLAQMDRLHTEMTCWTKHGHWVLNSSMTLGHDLAAYSPCPMHYGRRHSCRLQLESQSLRYYWTTGPGNCTDAPMTPFSARGFCDAFLQDHGSILVVGDSISELSATSWRGQFLLGLGVSHCPESRVLPSCHDRGLYAARNDRLSLLSANQSRFESTTASHDGHKFMEFAWLHQLDALNISLLVLNRGSHYENDSKLLFDVNETMAYLHRHHPRVGIVWRNTPYGVIDFHLHEKSPPLHVPIPPPAAADKYHYHLFAHQNEIVAALLREHYPLVLRLDAYTPSVLRLDSHFDAIHPCVPGPADTWLMLLYSALRRLHAAG